MKHIFNEYMKLPQGKAFADKYENARPEETVSCILCGSTNKKLWYRMGEFDSLICKDCNCRYVSPRYSDRQLDEHYSEDLFTKSKDYEGVLHNMLNPKERKRKQGDMKTEIDAVAKHIPDGGRVLDVGCQTGIFLEALPDKYEKFGVERSEWAAEHCKKIIDGKIYVGKIEDADFEKEYFDAINISYVVEHLQYPAKTLKHILSWLKKDGILIISVPNFGCLCSAVFREFYRLADPRQHIYLPTPSGLKNLMDSLGTQTVDIEYPYWSTPYCNATQLTRLFINSMKRLLLRPAMKCGLIPKLKNIISPPFWGNIMVMVVRK